MGSPQVQTPAIILCHPYMGVHLLSLQASGYQEGAMSVQGHKSYHVNAKQPCIRQEFQGGLLIYS